MADAENPALGKNLSKWKGIGAQVLKSYLDSENGGEKDDDNFSIDAFLNDFEDEFPNTVDEGAVKPVYSEFAGRAFDQRPWGLKFGDRPKIHELNQPQRAQELGWRVIDFYPNRELKAEYYRLAGTPAELRTMTQILRATREIAGKNINFEEWFKLWEDGFPEIKENRTLGTTNYPLDGENPWRGKAENKPRYREWTKPQQRLDLGFRVIEYWRDRSLETESVILSGTDLDLIRHILQIEYEGGGSAAANKGKGFLPSLVGQPFINIYFYQEKQSGKYRYAGEKMVRIMDKSDNPSSPLSKISNSDIKGYANRIKLLFKDFVWQKGRECVSYKGVIPRQQGIDGWAYVKTKADGIELFQKCAAVVEKTVDLKFIKHSKTEDEAGAFPPNPAEVTILGKPYTPPIKRPVVDVKFTSATLVLPYLGKEIPLVKGETVLFVD